MEEIKETETTEKNEENLDYIWFIEEPHVRPLHGIIVHEDTIVDCYSDNNETHQTIKNFEMKTVTKRKITANDIEFYQEIEETAKLKEGTRLLWTDDQCYVSPNINFCLPEEGNELIKCVSELNENIKKEKNNKEVKNEFKRN